MTYKSTKKVLTKFYCDVCDYYTTNKSNLNKHFKTRKHNDLQMTYKKYYPKSHVSTNLTPKNITYLSSQHNNLENIMNNKINTQNVDIDIINHNQSQHLDIEKIYGLNTLLIVDEQNHVCQCGRSYKHRQSLYSHKKKCKYNKSNQQPLQQQKKQEHVTNHQQNDNLVQNNSKANANLMDIINRLIDQNNKAMDTINKVSEKPNTVINQQNNSFSIINYLNNECKDALNLADFVNNLKVTNQDLEFMHHNTLMDSIDNYFIKPIANMKQTERPIHCTNARRHKFMIMHKGIWQRDEGNQILSDSFHEWANKVGHQLVCWSHEDKEWADNERKLEMSNDLIRKLHLLRFDKKTNEKVIKKMGCMKINKTITDVET